MPDTMSFPAFEDVPPLQEGFAPHFLIGTVLGQRVLQGRGMWASRPGTSVPSLPKTV